MLLQPLLSDLKRELNALYGEKLQGVYLFGSYARGEQDDGSDVDVLIVLSSVPRYAAEIDRTGDLISTISLKYNLTISRIFCDLNRWQHSRLPLFLNIRSEALAT